MAETLPIDVVIRPDPKGRQQVEQQLAGIERRADLTEEQIRQATKFKPDLRGENRVKDQLRGLDRRADMTEREFRNATRFRPDVAGYARINNQMRTLQAQAQRTRQIVGSIFLAVGAGVGITSTIDTWADFGRAMSSVQAISMATTDSFKALREEALRLGSTTEFTATDAANGITFLAQAGFTAEQSLIAISDTLNLATAGSIGLARSADLASNILSGFGLQVEDLTRVVDVMALTASSANTNIEQLGQAMSFAAPVAANFGVTVEETSAAIGILGNSGIQASRAGTALNAAFARLASGRGRYFHATLNALGLTMEDVSIRTHGFTGVLQNLNEAGATIEQTFALVGREAGGSIQKLIDGADDVEALTNQLNMADGSANRMAGTMRDNLRGSIDSARSAWEGLTIALGDSGGENSVRSFIDSTTSLFRYLTENIELVTQGFKALGILVASRLVLGAFRTFGRVVGGLGGGLLSIFSGGLVGGFASIASSFVSIAGVSGGVIAALTAFRGTFQESSSGAVRRIGDSLDAMVSVIETLVSKSFPQFFGFEQDFDGLLNTLAGALEGMIDTIFGFIDRVNGAIGTLTTPLRVIGLLDESPEQTQARQNFRGNFTERERLNDSLRVLEESLSSIDSKIEDINNYGRTISENYDTLRETGLAEQLANDNDRERTAAYRRRDEILTEIAETTSALNGLATELNRDLNVSIGATDYQGQFRRTLAERRQRTEGIAEARRVDAVLSGSRRGDTRDVSVSGGILERLPPPDTAPPPTGLGQVGRRRLLSEGELDANYRNLIERQRELAILGSDRQQIESDLNSIIDEYGRNQIELSDMKVEAYRNELEALQGLENRFKTLQEVGETVFSQIGEAVEQFARRGEIDVEDLVNNVLLQFARISANSVAEQLQGGFENILTSIFGGGSSKLPIGAGLDESLIPGANQGGVFTVRGRSGVDNNVLSLNGYPIQRVSQGEKIGTFQRGTGAVGNGGGVVINNYTTINAEAGDREGLENALNERDQKLEERIINHIDRRNYTNG